MTQEASPGRESGGVAAGEGEAMSAGGLKADPGLRFAWVARLNWLFLKSYPPTIALTPPLRGSMA